jgi:5-methylthioribose kinase
VSDGNLNLVYIVDGPGGSVCTKQSLPHVRADEEWQLPLQHPEFEVAYFAAVTPHAKKFLPAVYHYDQQLYLIAMENLTPHGVLRRELMEGKAFPKAAIDVGEYVARSTFFT